jgi:hypothetical protein
MAALGLTVAQLIEELDRFKERCGDRGDSVLRLMPAVSRSVTTKIDAMTDLTADNSVDLIGAADAALANHAAAFESALNSRLESHMNKDFRTKTTSLGQVTEHLDNYFTRSQLAHTGLTSTPLSRERLLVDLLQRLGITRVHAKTIAATESALLHWESDLTFEMLAYDDIYKHGRKFPASF